MKIITWNVRRSNASVRLLIEHALSLSPDVICFQELPLSMLAHVKNTGYDVSYTYDFISRKNDKSGLICTLTKAKPVSRRVIEYSNVRSGSILNRLVYVGMTGSVEQHCAPIVVIKDDRTPTPIQIVNARLSCAVGTLERLAEFRTIVAHLDPKIPAILAGDFNIVDNWWFNLFTGWIRGFKLREYFLNERAEFERIVTANGYRNIFRKRSTTVTNRPILQFDHILIPGQATVVSHHVEKKRFGSDHRMLVADLTFR